MALVAFQALDGTQRGFGFVAQPVRLTQCYNETIANLGWANTVVSRLTWSMYRDIWLMDNAVVVFSAIAVHDGFANYAFNANPAIVDGGNAYVNIAANTDTAVANGDVTGSHAREIHHFLTHGRTWWMDLIVAHGVKKLNAQNIVSYFQSRNIRVAGPNIMIQALDFLSPTLNNVVADAGIRGVVRGTTWGVYHTTASSVGQMYNRACTDFGNIMTNIVGVPQHTILVNLYAAPWDMNLHRLVTNLTLAKIYVALHASNGLPDNWYSGERANASLTGATRTAWRAAFVEILNRRNNLGQLANLATIDNIIDSVNLRG